MDSSLWRGAAHFLLEAACMGLCCGSNGPTMWLVHDLAGCLPGLAPAA